MSELMTKSVYTGRIESGVLPLCEVLNAIDGISTLWSCEGHPERPTPPFVVFFCSETIAAKLDRDILLARRKGLLKFNWWVRGNFDTNNVWRYTIEPNDRAISRPLRFGFLPNWKTRDMRTELARMSEIIREAFSGRDFLNENDRTKNNQP